MIAKDGEQLALLRRQVPSCELRVGISTESLAGYHVECCCQ